MAMANTGKMTDEERLALAEKLDKELDEFIDSLEKKRYTEGWPEDRWQEEMDKHPFFMKKPPEPGDELHPLLEGIQQLKYDPEENTKEDLAAHYKEDGNFYIKHKKYRMAILSITEGIKMKSENKHLNAVLYNNRSAAHFFIQNHRSSLLDAQKALELEPGYEKPKWRAAQCAYQLNKCDLCIQYCEEILDEDPINEQASDLEIKCRQKMAHMERDLRKEQALERMKQAKLTRTIEELKKRKIKFDDQKENAEITEDLLTPKVLPLEDFPVQCDGDNTLIWPAAFQYPEFLVSDFQQQLNENITMEECINEMFAEPMECDKDGKYGPGKLSIYYENRKTYTTHKVDLKKTIRQITEEKTFLVTGGSLHFYVVPTGSIIEQQFVSQIRGALRIK